MVIFLMFILNVEDVFNFNVVKVLVNIYNEVIYFFCVVILFECNCMMVNLSDVDLILYFCYIGIYVYRVNYV